MLTAIHVNCLLIMPQQARRRQLSAYIAQGDTDCPIASIKLSRAALVLILLFGRLETAKELFGTPSAPLRLPDCGLVVEDHGISGRS